MFETQQYEDTNKRESHNLESATQRKPCLCFIELLAAINTAEFPVSHNVVSVPAGVHLRIHLLAQMIIHEELRNS